MQGGIAYLLSPLGLVKYITDKILLMHVIREHQAHAVFIISSDCGFFRSSLLPFLDRWPGLSAESSLEPSMESSNPVRNSKSLFSASSV